MVALVLQWCQSLLPKYEKCEDLTQALSTACSLSMEDTLLVAEIYNHRIIRFLEDPFDSLSLIGDEDRLVAYRLPKDTESSVTAVFMHQEMEEQHVHGKLTSGCKSFGIPLVARFRDTINGSDCCNQYMKLLNPFLLPREDNMDAEDATECTHVENVAEIEADPVNCESSIDAEVVNDKSDNIPVDSNFIFYLTDERGALKNVKIEMADPVASGDCQNGLMWPFLGQRRRLNFMILFSLALCLKFSSQAFWPKDHRSPFLFNDALRHF